LTLKEKLENRNRFFPVRYSGGLRLCCILGHWVLPTTVGERLERLKGFHLQAKNAKHYKMEVRHRGTTVMMLG